MSVYSLPAIEHYASALAAALILIAAQATFIWAAYREPERSVIFAPYYHFCACAIMLGGLVWQSETLISLGGSLPDIFRLFYWLFTFGASPVLVCGAPLWVWLWRRI